VAVLLFTAELGPAATTLPQLAHLRGALRSFVCFLAAGTPQAAFLRLP
jgi:hypothetical protein